MVLSIRHNGFRSKNNKPTTFLKRRRSSRPTIESLESRALLTTLVGLGNANNLLTFDSASPGTIVSTFAISGIPAGVSIKSIANRPATGGLLALGDNSRLYSLNVTTGGVTAISSTAFTPSLIGSQFAISTNPITDTVRLVDNAGQNFRINPITGASITPADPLLSYAAGDPNVSAAPDIVALAHTNNSFGATSTTAYAIDASLGTLDRLGSVGGTPDSPNNGKLSTIGLLGVSFAETVGFDIVGSSNVAYAALTVTGSTPALYSINLASGAATRIGTIDGGTATIIGLGSLGPVTPAAPNLATASDSGVSNTDHITNVTTPVIQGTALPNANIIVLANGVNVGMGTANGFGLYSITVGPALAPGSYTVQIVQSDSSGLFSSASAPLSPTLVIKTSAATPGVPNLFTSSDTGYSSTDHYTRVNSPAFFGTGEAGDTVQLFANGLPTPIAQGPVQVVGQYALQSVQLADGTYSITASQTDVAGNISPMSTQMIPLLIVDTTNRPRPVDSFVNQLSLNLLHTPATNATFDLLTPLVTGPSTRILAVQTLLSTSNYRQAVVRTDYETLLHREPEPSALTIGDTYLLTHSNTQLQAILAGSGEYYALHGGTNTSYLTALYPDLLGRPIDAPGMTKYLAFLNAGGSPQTVVLTILTSPEGFSATATKIYQSLLGRTPDQTSLTNMVNILSSGGTENDLIGILASSDEYFQAASGIGLDLSQWGRQIYLDLLGRPADVGAIASIQSLLLQGFSTTQVVQALQQSTEYQTTLVNQAYEAVLRRAPDPGGLAGSLAYLNQGGTFQGLEASLYGTQEYYIEGGGGTNAGFLSSIYNDILGRTIDPTAAAAGLASLNAGTMRSIIAAFLLSSPEGSAKIVQQVYQTYLRRQTTFAESTSISAKLSNGSLTYTDLVASVVGTQEYFSGL